MPIVRRDVLLYDIDRLLGRLSVNCVRIWWRHQMETFSALLALCVGNSPVTGEFPSQRPVTRSLDAFFDLRLNKRLSKQSWSWWFETPSRSLWRHDNDYLTNTFQNHFTGVYKVYPNIPQYQHRSSLNMRKMTYFFHCWATIVCLRLFVLSWWKIGSATINNTPVPVNGIT